MSTASILTRVLVTTLTARGLFNLLSSNYEPLVKIEQGFLRGIEMRSRLGRKFYSFQGIPYAAPPIGNLRFRPPMDPPPWKGEKWAWIEGNDCAHTHFVLRVYTGQEDCLYLNVYTPKLRKKGAGLNVMVYFHGGGFYAGSGSTDFYGPNYLMDHDVVLVTFNYRLGIMGFLNMGIKEATGNYGLKDSVAALKWVRRNIETFGGNPNSITIFGQSSGAATVHYLMLSPLSRGLFHRAIVQSGSAYNNWALQRDTELEGRAMALKVGCKQNTTEAIVNCLRHVDAKALAMVEFKIRKSSRNRPYYGFGPSVEPADSEDEVFLGEDPHGIMARGDIADVPLMAGYTTLEGYFNLAVLLANKKNASYELFSNPIRYVPSQLHLEKDSDRLKTIWKEISEFYEELVPNDLTKRFVILASDITFNLGVDELVRNVAALQRNPVYYYIFSYEGGRNLLKRLYLINGTGTTHIDELGYLFSRPRILQAIQQPTKLDIITVERMTKLWCDFADKGNPTPDTSLNVNWQPVTAPLNNPDEANTRYLDIGEELVMHNENLIGNRIRFWRNLIAKYKDNVFYIS